MIVTVQMCVSLQSLSLFDPLDKLISCPSKSGNIVVLYVPFTVKYTDKGATDDDDKEEFQRQEQ